MYKIPNSSSESQHTSITEYNKVINACKIINNYKKEVL